MKFEWPFCAVVLLICACFAHLATAQTGPSPCSAETQRNTGGTPPVMVLRQGWYVSLAADVDLRLTLQGNKSVFYEGEIIPLKLVFTTNAKQKYTANTRTYDRSGRLDLESFCVTPDTGSDPLEDYYGSGIWSAFQGGGISSGDRALTRAPYVINEELNEWKSLKPGRYTLRVVSGRVDLIRSGATGPGEGPILVLSNAVTFQVIAATPQWQAEELARAVSLLDTKHENLTQGQFEQIRRAMRVLRFLGSEAATRELARRFWSHDRPPGSPHGPDVIYPASQFYQSQIDRSSWDFRAGLIASPCRAVAIRELNAAIDNHEHPATRAMVETLALLEIQSKVEYKVQKTDDRKPGEEWEKRRQAKIAAYNNIVDTLWKQVTSTR
jgi:hypothetical protein